MYISEDILVGNFLINFNNKKYKNIIGHFRHLIKDMINTKINIKKSDKVLILCGDDVIIKRNLY